MTGTIIFIIVIEITFDLFSISAMKTPKGNQSKDRTNSESDGHAFNKPSEHFDASRLPQSTPICANQNQGTKGKFKDNDDSAEQESLDK